MTITALKHREATLAEVIAAGGRHTTAVHRYQRAAEGHGVSPERIAALKAEMERAQTDYTAADHADRAAVNAIRGVAPVAATVVVPPVPHPTRTAMVPQAAPTDPLKIALSRGEVLHKEHHQQAVEIAVEAAERKSKATIHRLRTLLKLADGERVAGVLKALNQVPAPSRTGKHDDTCWQRHTGCLANHLRDIFDAEGAGR